VGPNLAYFDVSDPFTANCSGGENDAGILLLSAPKVSFKLSIGQGIPEKSCTPFNKISLCWHPRNQARKILARKGMECDVTCRLADHLLTLSEARLSRNWIATRDVCSWH
jgi:hypothetical protein